MMRPPAVINRFVGDVAGTCGLPRELGIATAHAATGWVGSTALYDPTYDAVHVQLLRQQFRKHPDWLVDGPTAAEFFTYHPEHEIQQLPALRYDFVAQTTLASRYGPFGLRYPVALGLGFLGAPAELCLEDEYRWGVYDLAAQFQWAEERGERPGAATKVAIARSNGMTVGNHDPAVLGNEVFVEAVASSLQSLYGRALW